MQSPRRTPLKVMEHVSSLLMAAIASLNDEIRTVLALGISVSNDVLEVKCGAQRAADIAKERPASADHRRMEYLLGWVEQRTESLKKLQFGFYSALCTKDLLRLRINALHPSVYSIFWERIEARMSEWDAIRLTPRVTLEQVRPAYDTLIAIIEKAESMPVSEAIEKERKARAADRLHLTLVPRKPKPAPARRKNHTTGTAKGSHSEIPNAGGTSKKSLHAQRKRARQSA